MKKLQLRKAGEDQKSHTPQSNNSLYELMEAIHERRF